MATMGFHIRTSFGATLARRSMGLGLGLGLGACSAGDDGAGAGNAADAALADTTCYLGLRVPGVEHEGLACSGTDTSTTVTGLTRNTVEAAVRVDMDLGSAPALGALDVQRLTIDVPNGGVSRLWDAPVAACTAAAVDRAFDSFFSWTYYRIDVACSGPAVPAAENPDEPLELGDFIIVSFFTQQ